jgi:hypothetical protein
MAVKLNGANVSKAVTNAAEDILTSAGTAAAIDLSASARPTASGPKFQQTYRSAV